MAVKWDHSGVHYFDDIDLSHELVPRYLSMGDAAVDGRVDAHGLVVDGNANFRNLHSYERFYAWSMDVTGNADLSAAHIGDLFLRGTRTGKNLIGEGMVVDKDADLKQATAERIMLRGAEVGGTLFIENTDADYIDLRGATLDRLWVDDLEQYELRVDEDTWIGEVYEGYGVLDDTVLTEKETEFMNKVYDRPLFPVKKRDGAVFSYDELKQNFVMDSERQGVFGSLTRKDVITPVDDERYMLVTRQYR